MAVPAVTEVSRRQALHCRVRTLRPSRQHPSWPHPGQAKPDPQRRSSNHSAQAASSGNRRSNAGSDLGKSVMALSLQSRTRTGSHGGLKGISHRARSSPLVRPRSEGGQDVKLDRRAVASMLLAVAGGLAVGLLGAREATATPLDCETDAVPFVYKGWYNDNGYVWFKNNSGKPMAVQVQGDQGPTPIAAG